MRLWSGSSGSAFGPVAGYSDHVNEPSKGEKFLN